MIKKAVIPAAGLGTRLLPITKEMPKEMLPIFTGGRDQRVLLKPMLQAVFEQLYVLGFREFCFIVGRGKRAIEDHFTPDNGFVDYLRIRDKSELAEEMHEFYEKIRASAIVFVNQPEPRGFGDAVLRAKPFVNEKHFLVHAGDTFIISEGNLHIKRLLEVQRNLKSEAVFVIQEVKDPRQYGVAEVESIYGENAYKVIRVIEKPERPKTNLAVMPVYVFSPRIFDTLGVVVPGVGGEVQLTDGIQEMINRKMKVYATKLNSNEIRLDIGNPEMCWEAMRLSYRHFHNRGSA
jgi:UTP--glucose-1-phosphate uridylyltransferase